MSVDVLAPSAPIAPAPALSSAGPASDSTTLPPFEEVNFPPFPKAPAGVTIIPFESFVPQGILISNSVSVDDELELTVEDELARETDALGIQTIMLKATHKAWIGPAMKKDDPVSKKRKHQRSARKTVIPVGNSGPARFMNWDEKWEDDEKQMGKLDMMIIPNEDRVDRVDVAVANFRRGRLMPSSIQSLYDNFLDFAGFKRHENQSAKKSAHKTNHKLDDNMDDDFSEDDTPDENAVEVWEDRLFTFFDNPERAMKVFFSTYYRDKGLGWTMEKLIGGPTIVGFFFDFLIKYKVLAEYDRELRKALAFINASAKVELPFTAKMSMVLNSKLHQAFYNDLGSMVRSTAHGWIDTEVDEARAAKQKLEWEKRAAEEAESKKQEETKLLEQSLSQGLLSVNIQGANGWGEVPGGAVAAWGDESAWDKNEKREEADNEFLKVPHLSDFLGPTSVPLTHSLLRTEESIRVVISVSPPDPNSPDVIRQTFGIITLGPWPAPSGDRKDKSYLKPRVLRVAEGEKEKAILGQHSVNDRIDVIILEEDVPNCMPGLGLRGVWVQVGKTSSLVDEQPVGKESDKVSAKDEKAEDKDAADTEKAPGGKKKKGKGGAKPKGDIFWFAQQCLATYPSYWTD